MKNLFYLFVLLVCLFNSSTSQVFAFEMGSPLPVGDLSFENYAKDLFKDGITINKLIELRKVSLSLTDKNGKATYQLQKSLQFIDRNFGDQFDYLQMQKFQGILGEAGVTTERAIIMPEDNTPHWFKEEAHPLENFQSSANLPKKADVVIIGAGLTGASAAYHLSLKAKEKGLKVVILEAKDPAGEASGRNGGNFELYPENFLGDYDGLEKIRFKFLQKIYPMVEENLLKEEAKRQAQVVMNFTSKNRDIFMDILSKENIDAEVVANGWIRIAQALSEVEGFREDAKLAKCLDREVAILSAKKVEEQTNIKSEFAGRYTQDGYYNPFKYVNGLLDKSLTNGIELYTRTPVTQINSLENNHQLIKTSRGTIEAKLIIVATNAFTSELFPELKEIQPWQSQIIITKHVPIQSKEEAAQAVKEGKSPMEAVPEMLITAKKGDIYAHPLPPYRDEELAIKTKGLITRRASYIQGGGLDTPYEKAGEYRRKNSVLKTQLEDRAFLIKGETNLIPPTSAWSGPMGFTPDGLMFLGILRPGIFIASGFNGYGGSFTQASGRAAAEYVLSGEIPHWVPQDIFSPQRFSKDWNEGPKKKRSKKDNSIKSNL